MRPGVGEERRQGKISYFQISLIVNGLVVRIILVPGGVPHLIVVVDRAGLPDRKKNGITIGKSPGSQVELKMQSSAFTGCSYLLRCILLEMHIAKERLWYISILTQLHRFIVKRACQMIRYGAKLRIG